MSRRWPRRRGSGVVVTGSTLNNGLLADILDVARRPHASGPCSPRVLEAIARRLAGREVRRSVETGCGVSTLLFSHLSRNHTAFTLGEGDSIGRLRASLLLRADAVTFVEGPTQKTLPAHRFEAPIDAALLDGPHAFPFPQLEYYYVYPHLAAGALLVIDDIHIPSVHQLFRFLKADAMFELIGAVDRAAFFRRTSAPAFPACSDGWEFQGYNKRRLARYIWKEKLKDAVPPALRTRLKRVPHGPWRRHGYFVRIHEPRQGDRVGASGFVRGTARVPPGAALWLLARRKDQEGWWPQGSGPVAFGGEQWGHPCTYGEAQDVGHEFEIAAVVVDAAAAQRLQRWIDEGRRSGNHPPVAFPQWTSCRPATVTVAKGDNTLPVLGE